MMNLIVAVLLGFTVLNVPFQRIAKTDYISLITLHNFFGLNYSIDDSFINLYGKQDTISIDRHYRIAHYKGDSFYIYSMAGDSNKMLDATSCVYLSSLLLGKRLYWDSGKKRVLMSDYPPSIKAITIMPGRIVLRFNIDLECEFTKTGDTISLLFNRGFYRGPPFMYSNSKFIKYILTSYSSTGTRFSIITYKNVSVDTSQSTGFFKIDFSSAPSVTPIDTAGTLLGKHIIDKHKRRKIRLIVIDPGHGGKDPGAISKRGTREKDITIKIAKKVAKKLKKLGFKVILTRSGDYFVTLMRRAKIANTNKVDLFVSIHCNISRGSRANGIETYFLSDAKTKWERSVAAFENSVIKYEVKQSVDTSNLLKMILGDMAQNEFLRESQDLAYFVQLNTIKKTHALDRGVKQAGFYVLRGIYAPAILIETGFISNRKEEKRLKSSKYEDKIAWGIVRGILEFKQKYEK